MKLCCVMYQCLLKLYNENTLKSPWLSYIRTLLNNSGMSDVQICQDVSNYLWLKSSFEGSVKDQWVTEWRSLLSSKSSCISYVSYKDSFALERYLVKLPKFLGFHCVDCRLRTNNQGLTVVTGRYNGTPREERTCNKCNNNVIGDEYHVLLECNNQEIT